jgi:hypothetical protein
MKFTGITKITDKLFVKQWVIGLCRGNIKDIIRTRSFAQDIKWLPLNLIDHFYADPFLLNTGNGEINILFEDFTLDDFYANISLLVLDENLKTVNKKILLDTKSHLSYPFIFRENSKTYVFPEAAHSGKLSCYEYIPENQSLSFVQHILNLPLLDSTILKFENRYWIFGVLKEKGAYKLNVYFSHNLLGPYTSHPGNPLKQSLNGTRSAGNFIEVDGVIYRPTQNCETEYGESITINRIKILNESDVAEEPCMTININNKNRFLHGIHTIHTINESDNIIAVDGMKWIFSPWNQWKTYNRNKNYFKKINSEDQTNSVVNSVK